MVTKIKQIFKQAVLRFWSLRVPLIVVCILLAALLCTAQYQDSSRVASAQMTLNYSEASQGLNPNRTRFTTTDLTSDEVLQSTLYNAGLEGQMTVEQLRKAITVEPTDVTNVSSSENYITTSCSISLQLEEPCQHLTAATLLRIFCGSYKDYFMEHYGENQSVFSCTMPDYFDTEPYLRLKSLTLRANQLDRYLTARVSENKSYQDATTGNTFLSLSKQIQNVINYEIPRIQAYILRGGLSADVSSLTAMLQYKLQIEQLDYQEQMAYYNSDNLGIGLYDESMSAIVMIPTLDENSEFYMSRTKTALDTMASDNYSSVLLMSIGGAALVFLGLVLTATFWLPVLMRGVGALVSMFGPSAKVAHANIQKNPRRVAATGTALLIGVTLVATIATGAASAKQTMGEALASRYSVDMIATGDGLKTSAVKEAAQVKGVAATMYAPTATVTAEGVNGGTMSLLLVGVKNTSELAGVMHADLSGVTVGDDTVLLPKYRATSGKEITFGSDAKLRFTAAESNGIAASTEQDGSASASSTNGGVSSSMRLKPVQSDYRRVSSNYDAVAFINTSHFNNGDVTATSHMLLMRVDTQSAGVSLSDVFNKIQDVFSYDSTVSITGPVAQRAQWETIINSMLMLLVALIAVAVLIALIGVANTLSLSVIERTRESATLRAIGMTRGQLRRSLAVEALLLSLVAGVVGVVLGTLFGWLGSYMVFSLYGKTVFPFEWGMNGIVLVVAAIAALLASVFPARRAVKTPPVEALAEA